MFKYSDKEVLKYLLALMGAIVFGMLLFLIIEHLFQKKINALEMYAKVYEQDAAGILGVQNDIISIESLMLEATAATDTIQRRDTLQVFIREKALRIMDTCKSLGSISKVENGYDSSFLYIDELMKVCKPLDSLIEDHRSILKLLNIRDMYVKTNDAANLAALAKRIRAFNSQIPPRIKDIELISNNAFEILQKEHEQFNKWLKIKKKEFLNIKYVILGFGVLVTLWLIWLISSKTIKLYKRLEAQLYVDSLTGLYSRVALQKSVEQSKNLTLVLIDIHAFRSINELYGIQAGNIILKEIGKFLQKFQTKEEVSAYRIASDEFVLLYENILMSEQDLQEELQKLLDYLSKKLVWVNESIGNVQLEYNLAGVACKNCADNPMGRADMALNHAKDKNLSFAVYTKSIDKKVELRQNIFWKKAIKEGLEKDAFVPFFQKIVDKDGKTVKYEALMRLQQETEKESLYVPPFKYLEIAKKTKFYLNISSLVIQKSLIICKNEGINISINISAQDMQSQKLKEMLKETIDKEQIASRVIFEIVESESILGNDKIKEFVKEFREIGVRFAIDDFGSGFSNFSFILEIKPEFLKIDGSLIKNITEDNHSYQLVKSIVAFAKALKMTTIAEFVHSKEVYETVLDLGVDEFQGYYFHEPSKILDS